jgi:hypothetical protein
MGRGGKVLRSMEEEWNTLMFFAVVKGGKFDGIEKLAIFGTRRARRGAELKVFSQSFRHHITVMIIINMLMPVKQNKPPYAGQSV